MKLILFETNGTYLELDSVMLDRVVCVPDDEPVVLVRVLSVVLGLLVKL
jgi:hypothetical protein